MTSPSTAGWVELVRVYRSGFHEGSHFGAVVVTDADGEIVHARGDVDAPVFPRSSNKPFQAVAMLEAGADLADADLAIAAASHSGEPQHVDRVRAMLAADGLTEDHLGCPATLPYGEAARLDVLRAGGDARRVYMNCSGKHAGMLRAARVQGWDLPGYLAPDHPLQQRVAGVVGRLADENPSAVGIDGCGAPLFAISLTGLARAFGRVNAAPAGSTEQLVASAMRAHPEMVGGAGRDDTLLMGALPGVLVKGGAEGVHCAALPDGTCVAVKIADGGDRARMPVLVSALRELGLGPDPVLDQLGTGTVLGGGQPVGEVSVAPGLW